MISETFRVFVFSAISRSRCSLVPFISAKIAIIVDMCIKNLKQQLRQANSSTYITGNKLFVWIRRHNRQTQLGLGAIPVFNRCTGMAPTCNWKLKIVIS